MSMCQSVLFHPAAYDELFEAGNGPMAAVVKFVNEDGTVNVTVFGRRDNSLFGRTGMQVVPFGGKPSRDDVSYCEVLPVAGSVGGPSAKAIAELQQEIKATRDDVSALANLVTKPDVIEAIQNRVDGLAESVAKLSMQSPSVGPAMTPAAQ